MVSGNGTVVVSEVVKTVVSVVVLIGAGDVLAVVLVVGSIILISFGSIFGIMD